MFIVLVHANVYNSNVWPNTYFLFLHCIGVSGVLVTTYLADGLVVPVLLPARTCVGLHQICIFPVYSLHWLTVNIYLAPSALAEA